MTLKFSAKMFEFFSQEHEVTILENSATKYSKTLKMANNIVLSKLGTPT